VTLLEDLLALADSLQLFLSENSSDIFECEYRYFALVQKHILKQYKKYLPLKLRRRAARMIKEGDVNILLFHSRLCNMEITFREFLAILMEYLETEHIFFGDDLNQKELQFLENIFRQPILQQKDVDKAASLLSYLPFEERLKLEKHLLSGKVFDFKGA